MKNSLALLTLMALTVGLSLSQTGCTGVYAVAPGPAYYAPSYPVGVWGGTGFYTGATYRAGGWNGGYYRNPYRGSSAAWHNGSGSAYSARGGSASWGGGSGSATGWRGGSASWGGGSGSWSGAGGRSGSWSGGRR